MTFRRQNDKQVHAGFTRRESSDSREWPLHALLAAVFGWLSANILLLRGAADLLDDGATPAALWLSMIPVHFAAFAAALIVIYWRVPPPRHIAALNLNLPSKNIPHTFGVCTATALAFYPIGALVTGATDFMLEWFGHELPPPPLFDFLRQLDNPAMLASVIAAAVLIAPPVEEILFRLVLFEALRPVGAAGAAVLTSAAFAVMHGALVQVPALFMLALLLQYARSRYRTLWAPICMHAVFNATSVILLLIFRDQLLPGAP